MNTFGRPPIAPADQIRASTENMLLGAGFSVINSPQSMDPWHVSIGGVLPGVVTSGNGYSWPGNKSERKAIAIKLEEMFAMIIWP